MSWLFSGLKGIFSEEHLFVGSGSRIKKLQFELEVRLRKKEWMNTPEEFELKLGKSSLDALIFYLILISSGERWSLWVLLW